MTSKMSLPSQQINKKIMYGILLIGAGIFVLFNILDEDTISSIMFPMSVGLSCGVSVMAFLVSKNKWGTDIFGKVYLLLGFGFLSYAMGEITFYSLGLLGYERYPSIADVFFFALYPFVFAYLFLNIRFFLVNLSLIQKIWLPIIPILALTAYVGLSLSIPDAELNFDFWYGFIFVSAASAVLSASVLGASIFKQSTFGAIWLLLTIGILANVVGDVWYYHLEVFGLFSDSHPVNIIWHVSNMIMIFALYTQYFKFPKVKQQ